eukprot:g15987.t1
MADGRLNPQVRPKPKAQSYNQAVGPLKAASGGIYRCIHAPRVAIRAAPSATAMVLDTIHPGTLIRVSEVLAGWARMMAWVSKSFCSQDVEQEKALPEKAYILVDGSQERPPTQLIERLTEEEEKEAKWPFRDAMEVRCLEAPVAQRKSVGAGPELRKRFVETALGYVGTPYHRSHHDPASSKYKPGSKMKDAPLFLDHIQLIQKVVDDLKKESSREFGFLLIANCKAVHCRKTLPISFEDPEDCEEGDLIFYEEIGAPDRV